jgi:hypothetical protein
MYDKLKGNTILKDFKENSSHTGVLKEHIDHIHRLKWIVN